MKTFKFTVDLEKTGAPEEEIQKGKSEGIKGLKKLFENLMNQGLNVLYPHGLTGKNSRTYFRLLSQIDDATDEFISVNDDEHALLKEVFANETKEIFLAPQTRLVALYAANLSLTA